MTPIDYRWLEFGDGATAEERSMSLAEDISTAVGWRHVGLVPLTRAQALAGLSAGGIAHRGAEPAKGRFPLVVLFGQFTMATSAEVLASHGFIVVAPFRFRDQANEVGVQEFSWHLENGVRDGEWALDTARKFPNADSTRIGTVGHGGGGLQALLFAMRNPAVAALATLDSSIFSSRSAIRDAPFYSTRLLRSPFLFIATADTRRGQDIFDDFLSMKFAHRYEMVLNEPAIRHHDLSDFGRAVTAPLGIRGPAQPQVERVYRDVHGAVVRFLDEFLRKQPRSTVAFSEWMAQLPTTFYGVAAYPAAIQAPTLVSVLSSLDGRTVTVLKTARKADPRAPLFQLPELERIVATAIFRRQFRIAIDILDFADEVHPGRPTLADFRSEALEREGYPTAALQAAEVCASSAATNDWRQQAAIDRCKERAQRLTYLLNPLHGQ